MPQLEAIQLDNQQAILIKSSPTFTQLFLQVGDTYYIVGGQVTQDELLKLATSIPPNK